MDRLIRNAWRLFWVGLGASAVLIVQGLLAAPKPAASLPTPSPSVAVEIVPAAPGVRPPARRILANDPASLNREGST